MNRQVMFSSASSEWGTPLDFWKAIDREFGFTLDLAASAANHKVDRYFSAENSLFDHLDSIKNEVCWLNPVYGRKITDFIDAACDLHHRGNTVVLLPPARTDTAWWSKLHQHADEIRLIRGRLKFTLPDGTTTDPAPFPSALIVLRPRSEIGHTGPKYSLLQPSHYIARYTELRNLNATLFEAEERLEARIGIEPEPMSEGEIDTLAACEVEPIQ